MLAKITKRAVDALHPNGADQFLWDTDLKGFGLKVTAGGNKVYILQYRKGGRGAPTRRVTIGRHGALTPDQARKEAARLSGALAHVCFKPICQAFAPTSEMAALRNNSSACRDN